MCRGEKILDGVLISRIVLKLAFHIIIKYFKNIGFLCEFIVLSRELVFGHKVFK